MNAQVHELFGEQIPYGDPSWYQGSPTPYYTKSHAEFRTKVREFVETEMMPYISEWEEKEAYPKDLVKKMFEKGLTFNFIPLEYGGNTAVPDYDAFHDLILADELARCGSAAAFVSHGIPEISLPPILHSGTEEMKKKIIPAVISGKKFISLAITEPWAGSDVSNVRTSATRTGDEFIVNGQKKFITSGTFADYFVTVVRTGTGGMFGVSLLLIDSKSEGVKVRRLKTQGWTSSGTAHIVFEDVRVPCQNLIGKENNGFKMIMHNFNNERMGMCITANRYSRVCIEESIKYAKQRQTFGKSLIDHQVIRHKLADMIRNVECIQSQIEYLTFQQMNGASNEIIGGAIALLKVQCTQTVEYCAREASQIFGGNSVLKTGPGEKIERIYRDVRIFAIGGGSEEIMKDLAMRQANL